MSQEFVDPTLASSPSVSNTGGGTMSLLGRLTQLVGKLRTFKDETFRGVRPWKEFFDKSKFSLPGKIEAVSRSNKNLRHFYSNYLIVACLVSIYVFITNLAFTMSMAFCGCLYYYYKMSTANGEPYILRGTEITPVRAYTSLILLTALLFMLTDGSGTIFWVVTVSGGVVLGHAASRQEPDAHGGDFLV